MLHQDMTKKIKGAILKPGIASFILIKKRYSKKTLLNCQFGSRQILRLAALAQDGGILQDHVNEYIVITLELH